MKKPKIFIACDTTSVNKVKRIIRLSNNSQINFGYKFGLEFLNSKNGRKFISKLKNKITFGDYKLSDIPNTCVSSIKAVKDLKFNYFTIHLNSGLKAIKAAKKISGNKNLKKLVFHQAKLATRARLDAIVCSPEEIQVVKKIFKKEIITPGIRLQGDKKGDQKRVMTPKQAFQNGATSLVMGRSLTNGNIKNNIQRLIEELK